MSVLASLGLIFWGSLGFLGFNLGSRCNAPLSFHKKSMARFWAPGCLNNCTTANNYAYHMTMGRRTTNDKTYPLPKKAECRAEVDPEVVKWPTVLGNVLPKRLNREVSCLAPGWQGEGLWLQSLCGVGRRLDVPKAPREEELRVTHTPSSLYPPL